MTGPELKQLREDLGDAIGRRLSLADIARLCGLAPANGADTMRKWEEGEGPSGPVAALLSLIMALIDRDFDFILAYIERRLAS
jgi:transcriptional regulator with XRE-family HTH domain